MTVVHELTAVYSRRRFACLFFSLLITMVAAPVLGAMGLGTRFIEIFLGLNILAAVLVTVFSFGTHLGVGLLLLLAVSRAGHALLGQGLLLDTSLGVGVVICLLAIGIMLRLILSEGSVTSERIFAALDVYLLVGVTCGLLFCVFEEMWPGSFSFQGSTFAETKQSPLAHTIYFSFVTLGTLGYGDIIPVGGPVRALAVAEAMIGQMYLVVIVARLVSLYKGKAERNDGNTRDEATHADDIPQP
jgi:hypothetical protein